MTTKADTSVKWFRSGMADAPVLSASAAGSLINLLDACLLNGFSVRTPDSIVVAGGIATVSISAGNPYEKHAVVVISGASNAALNAEWKIATSAASSFTFVCPGVADGAVTGASVKRAGAGWGKPFSGTNIAVYQSLDPNSTQLYLQVADTATNYSSVRGYEQMTSATAGTGAFPTTVQTPTCRWPRSGGNTWTIIADGSFMWVLLKGSADPLLNNFGDIEAFKPNDRYHCLISAAGSTATNGTNHPGAGGSSVAGVPRSLARSSSQTGGALTSVLLSFYSTGSTWDSFYSTDAVNTLDGNLRLGAKIIVHDGLAFESKPRGHLPGAVSTLNPPRHLSTGQIIEAGDDVLLAVNCNTLINSPGGSVALFDIKGPWR